MSLSPLPLPKTPAYSDVGIEHVISSESKVQQMKQIWRSKLQNKFHVIPTDDAVLNTNVGTESTDITKKDAKEEPVTAAAVTRDPPPGIPWVLREIEMPHLLRNPLVRRKSMAVGHAMQADGGLPSIKEETGEEELQVKDEMSETEATLKTGGEDESLNSGDDPSGDEAAECDRLPVK